MCGIVGFRRGQRLDEAGGQAVLRAMCRVIAHRGPDDEGFFLNEHVGLGMKRLAIIDLKGGHQPIADGERAVTIVYNGEIYNYRDLRAELLQGGACFTTESDTEVALRMYCRYGKAAFAQFMGMFAIALYDGRAERLVLCRDQIGIKPLYYYWDGHTFAFASEIKAILQHPDVTRKLNEQAVWDYLTYEYVPAPLTMFDHIYKLPPGHLLELPLRGGAPTVSAYWDYPLSQDHDCSEEEASRQLDPLLDEVVRQQLVADVPVGVFLSGGLDSTAVTLAASRVTDQRLKTFCVGFEEGTLTDETIHARETAAFLGVDHHELITNAGEYWDFLQDYVYLMDEPDADMAAIGKHFACQLAARHVKVVLSGDGGDEMFCGYRMHDAMRRFDQLRRLQRWPRWLACDIPAGLARRAGRADLADRIARAFVPPQERAVHTLPSMALRFTEAEKTKLFRRPDDTRRDSLDVLRGDYQRARSLEPVTQIQYAWSKQWLAEHLLMQADRMSMGVSIELRVPLLDVRLVEFLFRLPDAVKVRRVGRRYETKHLLRRFLAGHVPASVLTRPKRGFQIPNVRFIERDFRDAIGRALTGSDTRIAGLLQPETIRHWVDAVPASRDHSAHQKVWILFILELWARRWL